MPLVLECHRDAILSPAPELFAQAIIEFLGPLAAQKCLDLLAALKELLAVAPVRVHRVSQCHALWIAGVPRILSRLHLGFRSLQSKRRVDDRWRHGSTPPSRFLSPRLFFRAGRARFFGRGVEAIADPRLGVNIAGMLGVWLYFFPELIDEHAQIFGFFAIVRSPDGLQQTAVPLCFSLVGDQMAQ